MKMTATIGGLNCKVIHPDYLKKKGTCNTNNESELLVLGLYCLSNSELDMETFS